jgi:hypothetical protein
VLAHERCGVHAPEPEPAVLDPRTVWKELEHAHDSACGRIATNSAQIGR